MAETKPLKSSQETITDFRRLARQLALQMLHQLDVQNGANLYQVDTFLNEYGPEMKVRQLADKWIKGAWQAREHIDRQIEDTSKNWKMSRINPVDRANLRLAVFQLLDCPDIPAKVVIDEAIEMAKTFSTAGAPRFINGILDTIMRKIKDV